MKKVKVTINLEMLVPEDWELVEHPDGISSYKTDIDHYMYMSFLPMLTKQFQEGSTWTSECSDELSNEILEMVYEENVKMEPISS